MFDTFGEFDSVEELNKAAEGQRTEGDKESLLLLAEENGIEKEDAEDYLEGCMDKLATETMAAYGRLNIFEKEEINKKKNVVAKMPLKVILDMTRTMIQEPGMAIGIMRKGKRIQSLFDKMKMIAKKHSSGGMGIACGTDRQLQEIIRAYFMGTDKELEETIEKLYKEG